MKRPQKSPADDSFGQLPLLEPQTDNSLWTVRALLQSTATPFAVAEYKPRAAIYVQGDPCESVMYIEKGRVWLAVTSRDGKEAICGVLDAGAFLGEDAIAGRAAQRHSATAMIATQVLVVAKADLTRLLHTQPGLMDRFLSHLLARNTRLEANLSDQLLFSSEERLAHTLLLLARCDMRRPGRCTLPGLPQEILAEMVGTTRSRVNYFMCKFKRLGFIDEHGGVLHINAARLRVVPARDRSCCTGVSRAIH